MWLNTAAIRQARHEAGLTLEGLSAKADIALTTLFGIESGGNPNPRIDTVGKIAQALDRDIRLFLCSNLSEKR